VPPPPFLDFRDTSLTGARFDLPPERAIDFFRAKGLKATFAWQDMIRAEHARAFTVAKMLDLDLLADVRQAVDDALAKGYDARWFRDQLVPTLRAKGWWGKQPLLDPLTGNVVQAQLGSPWRLNTIFRTNLQSAYAYGRWESIVQNADTAPWLLYDAVDDHRVRPEHKRLDNLVLRADDDFWRTHYPPNGWNCRCGVIQLSDDQLTALGLKPGKAPTIPNRKWTNPRTGKTYWVPEDLDPGWDYHPGLALDKHLTKLLAEKIAGGPPGFKAAAIKQLQAAADLEANKAAAQAALKALAKEEGAEQLARASASAAARAKAAQIAAQKAAVRAAQKQVAKEIGEEALERAQQTISAKAAAYNAEAELNAIAGGKAVDPGGLKKQAYEKLSNIQGFYNGSPQDRLQAVLAYAKKLEKEATDQLTVDEILAGIGNDPGKFLQTAAKKLAKDEAWPLSSPSMKLKAIEQEAKWLKEKHAIQTKLSQYKAAVDAGKIPPKAAQEAWDLLPDDEAEALSVFGDGTLNKQSMLAKWAKKKPPEPPKAAPEPPVAGAKAAPEPPPAAAKAAPEPPLTPPKVPDFGKLTQVGPQGGSNPGGEFLDPETGVRWYVKFPSSEDIARNEVLAARLYDLAGVETPEIHLINTPRGLGIASKIIDKSTGSATTKWETITGLDEGFAADAWLANWDVAGQTFDNLFLAGNRFVAGGLRAVRGDVGGALRYRAMGGLKGSAWTDNVSELDSLRDGTNQQTATVFKKLDQGRFEAGVRRVMAVTDDQIRKAVTSIYPEGSPEAAGLAERLIARRNSIRAKFPKLAPEPTPVPLPPVTGRITPTEAGAIRTARGNGFALRADGPDIEDQQVLFWTEVDQSGQTYTHAVLKVRGDAATKLLGTVRGAGAAGVPTQPVKFIDLDQEILAAIKGVASQAAKGLEIRQVDVDRIEKVFDTYRAKFFEISEAKAKGILKEDALQVFDKHYRPWLDSLDRLRNQLGMPSTWQNPTGKPFGGVGALPLAPTKASATPGIQWTTQKNVFYKKDIRNGYLTRTNAEAWSRGDKVVTKDGDVDISFWSRGPYALQNQIELSVRGQPEAAATSLMDSLERLGVRTYRPTTGEIEELYLRQIAYHRKDLDILSGVERVASPEGRVVYLKQELSRRIGTDITSLPDYRPDGLRQAFDTGRIHTYRPDLAGPEWDAFQREYRLHHSVTNGTMTEAIEKILGSGGQMAPTTDKLRRGITPGGMSPSSDLESGGASYFFTRIKRQSNAYRESGLVWKSRQLGRLDAISYDQDNYGRTTDSFVTSNRKTGVQDWKAASQRSSNETIFKNSLSLFDDLDAIVCRTTSERNEVIALLKRNKIDRWPDGRSLNDVVKVHG